MHTRFHHLSAAAPFRTSFLARLIHRLLAADARYRDRQRLGDLPDDRLADVGLNRADLQRELGYASEAGPHDPRLGW